MDPATLQAAKAATDYASTQSDRWMFVAMLVIFLLAVVFLAKWFMQQLDKANQSAQAAHAAYNDYLRTTGAELSKVVAECTLTMQRINAAGEEWFTKAKELR